MFCVEVCQPALQLTGGNKTTNDEYNCLGMETPNRIKRKKHWQVLQKFSKADCAMQNDCCHW
jgi:hypothetical protein